MTHQLGWKSWAAGAVVLVALTACTDDGATPPDAPPSATPSATSSGGASPTSPSEIASAAATTKVTAYFATVDELGKDSQADLAPLASVAISTQLDAARRLIKGQHRRGERQVGDTVLVDVAVQSVNLANTDPSAGKVPTVVIDVCWDVSGVDVVDKSGTSVVSPNRPDIGWTRYTVANYEFARDPAGGWRVASGEDQEKAPCAVS